MRIDLAAAFRLAVRLDLHEGVCNHFSVMLPDGKRFLLNRYGLHWSEVTASNLLALDADGKILEGEGEFEKTAFYIHSRIHLANPRATCVLHTHMPYATALTLLEGGRLEMVEQNALRFHDDIAYDDVYNGLVVDNAEGDRLARALGGKRVMFLANHGVIVVGPTVAEAFDALYYLERACRLQVLARSMGGKVPPGAPGGGSRNLPAHPGRYAEVRRRALRGVEAHPGPRGAGLFPLKWRSSCERRVPRTCRRSTRFTRTTCFTVSPASRRSRRRWTSSGAASAT